MVPQINNPVSNIPDTLDWLLVSSVYTAAGNEQYMTIGDFHNDSNTVYIMANSGAPLYSAYLYIDDVSLSLTTNTDNISSSSFSLFPNPNNGNFLINFSYSPLNLTFSKKQIIINDIHGREVARYDVQPYSNETQVKLPEMAKGVYVARLVGDGVSSNVKFVVQ